MPQTYKIARNPPLRDVAEPLDETITPIDASNIKTDYVGFA